MDNKKVVLFQTLGAEAYSDHGVSALANAGRYLSTSCKVVGTLSVRGAIDPKLIEAMMKMPEGHPHAPTEESKNVGRMPALILMKLIWKQQLSIFKNLLLFMISFINKRHRNF